MTLKQKAIPISPDSVREVVSFVLKLYKTSPQEVGICFVGKKRISTLHQQFFNDPSITDCITFPMDPPSAHCICLGEIFVCPQVAADYVRKEGGELYKEITLYVIHGLLHLLGQKDATLDEQKKMRVHEKKVMEALAKKGLSITPLN